ncbi:dTDP-4-dehydrorhamnose 3,5-epimerase family protein [Microvirga rosea]|uniref:dTDP-4-dehydrorhamnose 3,5-epimerase family protein n=1 Tax=Microvirga rosea TaxID=2715425 RepID=UPI001D0B0ECF|nr:dTDP-4-dehydrorhamnose 3,5-epimerase family protein [Microvirga rosea]MCB8823449.1 dTDP-4-dehydrorhamnose 3,5-epimerase family protein [Microvirga rosea]
MKFLETAVAGAFVVEPSPNVDERGSFVRTFCAKTFSEKGLANVFPQCSLSSNTRRGTLRGMHFQVAPLEEAKLVRATKGRIFDVAVDLRPGSESYLKWCYVELDARKANAIYIPPGCAHGFITLEDDCEVFYQISVEHDPSLARGVRWDDPLFAIDWPIRPNVISARDATYPDFEPPVKHRKNRTSACASNSSKEEPSTLGAHVT